ncbi:hypothetical protein [Pseudonocardia spinosispora]|uniref:hypothetical protein n=1 Tax=Pseudonocardia spinosispora TaxID=103441 RepID=UPI00040DF9BA|nr:hypothetical protein [Pseudonocardia spinosispora]
MPRSVGAGTEGTAKPVAALFDGLGELGGDGSTAVLAIAAQSEQLTQLGNDTGTLLDARRRPRGDRPDTRAVARRRPDAALHPAVWP